MDVEATRDDSSLSVSVDMGGHIVAHVKILMGKEEILSHEKWEELKSSLENELGAFKTSWPWWVQEVLRDLRNKFWLSGMSRSIRVRHGNAERMVEALQKEGFFAEYLGEGTASKYYDNVGCSDPDCCTPIPHPSLASGGRGWGAIHTSASGNRAHKIWVAAGLVGGEDA